jgi:hypothetical protein
MGENRISRPASGGGGGRGVRLGMASSRAAARASHLVAGCASQGMNARPARCSCFAFESGTGAYKARTGRRGEPQCPALARVAAGGEQTAARTWTPSSALIKRNGQPYRVATTVGGAFSFKAKHKAEPSIPQRRRVSGITKYIRRVGSTSALLASESRLSNPPRVKASLPFARVRLARARARVADLVLTVAAMQLGRASGCAPRQGQPISTAGRSRVSLARLASWSLPSP